MSISRFNLQTPASNAQSFYDFLNTNKTGTFLENTTIELSQDTSTLTIATANATFEIHIGSVAGTNNIVTLTGDIVSGLLARAGNSSTYAILMKEAILCNNGLIINIFWEGHSNSPEILLTIDNTGELAVILKSSSAFITGGSSASVATISGYRVTAAGSSSEATVTLTPQYGAQKTSLAPIVPMCNDNSISLPYAYAALHTQAPDVGLQSMRMNGSNYITNGVWYIKDGE